MNTSLRQNLHALLIKESAKHFCSGQETKAEKCIIPGAWSPRKYLWCNWEEFCKPEANEMRARYDLFKLSSETGASVDKWNNKVYKQLVPYEYPQKTASILSRDIFLFGI